MHLAYLLISYLLITSVYVLLNIFWNSRQLIQTCLNVGNVAAHRAGDTQACIRPDLWSPKRHDLNLQSDYQLWMHNIDKVKQLLQNVSCGMDHSIIHSAVDQHCGHLQACVQANYGHLSNCCDCVIIRSATGHEMFHFVIHNAIFKLYLH